MKSNSIYVVAFLFIIQFVFPPINHGRVIVPTYANLIDRTCQKTPNPGLCVSILKSDPRSADADVTGLALIMVDVVKADATKCWNKIKDLLKHSPKDQPLSSCQDNYNAVINADVPSANEALTKGVPKFAEQGMDDATVEAQSCESGFSGHSPMTKLNKASHDVAMLAAAIVRILL